MYCIDDINSPCSSCETLLSNSLWPFRVLPCSFSVHLTFDVDMLWSITLPSMPLWYLFILVLMNSVPQASKSDSESTRISWSIHHIDAWSSHWCMIIFPLFLNVSTVAYFTHFDSGHCQKRMRILSTGVIREGIVVYLDVIMSLVIACYAKPSVPCYYYHSMLLCTRASCGTIFRGEITDEACCLDLCEVHWVCKPDYFLQFSLLLSPQFAVFTFMLFQDDFCRNDPMWLMPIIIQLIKFLVV